MPDNSSDDLSHKTWKLQGYSLGNLKMAKDVKLPGIKNVLPKITNMLKTKKIIC